MIVRIGILGTGRIAERFAGASKLVGEVSVTAVYNPTVESARDFAERMGLPKTICVTDDLKQLFDQVDAVYIATPHETHADYIREAINAKKHVLCEKPMTMCGDEAAELYALAKTQQVILMEAVKTAYCPGFLGILKLLADGVIGQVHDVESCFTKLGSASLREIWGEYGGSFTELGSYVLLPVVKLLGTQEKGRFAWSLPCVTGTDSYTKVMYMYENGCATVKTGLGVKSEGELIIAGEKGYIQVPSPWWLTKHVEVHHENPRQIEVYDFPFEGSGLQYELAMFVKRVSGELLEEHVGLTDTESIWMAKQMEAFLKERTNHCVSLTELPAGNVNIWAHRGCSMRYPENTLLAFEEAAKLDGITGIELDVQLTKDGEMVVIHDEKLDRTTTGHGGVAEYTLSEIKSYAITPSGKKEEYIDKKGQTLSVPTLEEVFVCLKPYCEKNNLQINIELKNSVVRYEGMEEKVIELVDAYGLENNIVYSSFNHESVGLVKKLNPDAKTGTLSGDAIVCLEGAKKYHADALHPSIYGMAINQETLDYIKEQQIPVRMWTGVESLFGQKKKRKDFDLTKYAYLGMTDLITNVPEEYL